MRIIYAFICVIVVCSFASEPIIGSAATETFASIEPSLALVISKDGKHVGAGTAFCIGSHDDTAYLLTNRHVVGTDSFPRVIMLSDRDSLQHGQVVRTATLDAVVLAVYHSSCHPLTLSATAPPVGTQIGIAGFPAFQFSLANDLNSLQPSFHEGSVSSVAGDGSFIEYDAQTDHGNSGSPLFDMQTGVVYGMVTAVNTGTTGALQNNIALSLPALQTFLDNAKANVSFTSGSTGTRTTVSVTPGSVASLIDSHCGPGSSNTIVTTLQRSYAELNGNDYPTASSDARQAVELSNTCVMSLYQNCQGVSPCNDTAHVIVETSELMGQQVLRIAQARLSGDWSNAERNEITTALDLCSSPNIHSDSKTYSTARGLIAESFRVLRSNYRSPAMANAVDLDAVRTCATSINVEF